jgi:hypothetical protein
MDEGGASAYTSDAASAFSLPASTEFLAAF